MLRSNKPALELTAMTIIEGLGQEGVRVTGYNNGLIILTNIYEEARNPSQKHGISIGKKNCPEGSPAVTAMASVSDGNKATLIAGYSDASIRIMKVSLSKKGALQKHDNSIKIAQSEEKCSILAITILNNQSIAIILANGKIKVINFEPNLQKCKNDKKVKCNRAFDPTQLPTEPKLIAAAILPFQPPSSPLMYGVYVLNASNQLALHTYDCNFKCQNTQPLYNDIEKIGSLVLGGNNLILASKDNRIWQISPNMRPQPIDSTPVDLSAGISAITSNIHTIYIVTKNKTFATIPQPLLTTQYSPMPASAPIPSRTPGQPGGPQEPDHMMHADLEAQQRRDLYRPMPLVSQSDASITRHPLDVSPPRSRALTAPGPYPPGYDKLPGPGELPMPGRQPMPQTDVLPAAPGYGKLLSAVGPGGQSASSSSSSASAAPPPLQRQDTVYTGWVPAPASSHPPIQRRPTQILLRELDEIMEFIDPDREQSSAASSSASAGGQLDPAVFGSNNPFL